MLSGKESQFLTGFSSQCFPVRSLANYRKIDQGGAWLVAYRAEQRRRFKAVLSNEPVLEKPPKETLQKKRQTPEPTQEKSKKLDGFYLMKKFFIEDPSDLCSINISSSELYSVSEDDFLLFDNIVHVDAGDNLLPFNVFRNFMSLRELELPLNQLSGSIKVELLDFPYLQKLDLSYNRITSDDILALGVIPCLKTLHLTGNELKRLPIEMARTYRTVTGVTLSGTVESEDRKVRFSRLENLYLDDNELTDVSTFSSLAGLRKLKYLNLENNEVASIPHLRLLGARVRQKDSVAEQNTTAQTLPPEESNMEDEGKEAEEEEEEDKEGLMMDEVDEILSKKLPGGESNDADGAAMKIRHRASTLTEDASLLGDKYNPPKPFPTLLHLNLANNMVYEEEGLLAVMGWPKIKELVIWGNPLTTAFKGDPPVLSLQLGEMKGVRIFRQKPNKRPKPRVSLAAFAGYRKVKDALPPVPRKRDHLMLQSPSKTLPISYVGPHSKPLPPISAPSGELRSTKGHTKSPRQPATAPSRTGYHSKKHSRSRSVPPEPPHRPRPETQKGADEEIRTTGETTSNVDTTTTRDHQQAGTNHTDEGFFLTQVDELETKDVPDTTEPVPPTKQQSRKTKHQHPDRPFSVETRYKGYEDLLDVDEHDPDLVIPSDIQGSVRSLQYVLQHPLVFTESHGTYKETPKTKVIPKVKVSRQNKVEEMGQLLDKMRVENKIIESNLENVLQNFHNDPKLRKQFPEAKKLLDEVQVKYNEVRMKSLRSNAQARQIVQSTVSRDKTDLESQGSSLLEDDKQILKELAQFKKRLDGRI